MFLEGILAISGQAGLFKLISKGNNSVIVESLNTSKRMPAFASSRISTLSDVAIYTNGDDVPLREVFIKLFEKYDGQSILVSKSSNLELSNILNSVLPEYDKDRVYVSDIKKIVNWYNSLIEHNILIKTNIKIEENNSEETKTED